ncbi:MAG: hypothetical protein WAM73_00105 [Desulfobacterales bacterium]
MVREKDELYQRYVFQNALKSSDSRNLLIFVPIITDEQYGIAKITETPETLQANGSAKMIVMPGTDNNPNDFLKGIIEYSDFNFSEYDGDLIIVQKPFLGVAFDHIFFVREKNGVNTCSWRKIPTNVNLDWKARDRHEASKKRMKYLYTVPLDILTFPIQFLMMITWVFGDD